jgi:E3 ubiquitin-protein ligase RNF14
MMSEANETLQLDSLTIVHDSTEDDELIKEKKLLADRLRICESCAYAFCKLCNFTWHGPCYDCRPRSDTLAGRAQVPKGEMATLDYFMWHTSPCPQCKMPIQKTEACSHIQCSRCDTHFCYLCSLPLNPKNPYQHFNNPATTCYQRLWVLEEGDNSDTRIDLGGARGEEIAAQYFELEEEHRRATNDG